MLKKKQRLTKTDFDHYFKSGKRLHSPALQIIYSGGDSFKGAAVVGKKVFKSAVARNRLRRRLYGALYRYYKKHDLKGVFIIIAKPPAKDLKQKEITPLLETELMKIK